MNAKIYKKSVTRQLLLRSPETCQFETSNFVCIKHYNDLRSGTCLIISRGPIECAGTFRLQSAAMISGLYISFPITEKRIKFLILKFSSKVCFLFNTNHTENRRNGRIKNSRFLFACVISISIPILSNYSAF